MVDVTAPPPGGGPDQPADDPRLRLRDAVTEYEHLLTTHFAAIEGWLGLMEDDTLAEAQRCRAACVVRQRTEALRRDLTALLRLVKESPAIDRPHSSSTGQPRLVNESPGSDSSGS